MKRPAKHPRTSNKRTVQQYPPLPLRAKGMWIVNMLLLPVLVSVLGQWIILWLQHLLKW